MTERTPEETDRLIEEAAAKAWALTRPAWLRMFPTMGDDTERLAEGLYVVGVLAAMEALSSASMPSSNS